VDNIVTNLCAKFNDDRLWNEKALADRKSDINNHKKKKNNVRSAWDPFPGPTKNLISQWCVNGAANMNVQVKRSTPLLCHFYVPLL